MFECQLYWVVMSIKSQLGGEKKNEQRFAKLDTADVIVNCVTCYKTIGMISNCTNIYVQVVLDLFNPFLLWLV